RQLASQEDPGGYRRVNDKAEPESKETTITKVRMVEQSRRGHEKVTATKSMRERWAKSQAPPAPASPHLKMKNSIGLGLCVQVNVQKTELVIELLELSFYWFKDSTVITFL
ncbi:hypothetical protein PIB30_084648, partial [Stylosanthes scabra]|nr:hypothetical protein [Stylosanthes scabra]